ncbi:unnamed protein product [Oikopleura dioica]|uniref:Uncharacterized protein n=1 Tax=Oikopleura dioica TaxID=34765 RepID=E4YU66_OIKDI|nr:unnamed protein product [Oikopleura dioica]
MSLRFGDPLIKTSSTMSLNAIRESEEGTKGWKKGELSFPPEFTDLDPVHILPLLDLGRLLIVLVTRSIALSNTQYSLLLESEGRLLNLGSEWIGSRVKYQTRADCFSQMLALKDFYFTDNWGVNNDECEYFPNGFVLNDRIYLQSVVFDTTFELEMNFDFFDIEFYQLEETNRIHVSSNPQFAFHDDIFPTFAKNLFIQEEFPPPAFPRIHSRERTTHVPDLLFSSLAAFDHISSVVFDFAGVFVISFDLQWFHRIQKTTKVLELRLLGDEIFILLELLPDGTVQFSSSYLEEKVKIKKKVAFQEIFSIEIKINFNTTPTIQFCDSQKHQLRSLVLLKEQTMKIYKFGEETKIKKLATKSILFSGNGSYVASPTVFSPSNVFIQGSLNTVFQDNLYIFGGFIDGSKTAQLEGCEMIELKQRLVFDVESYFADVVPIKDETEGPSLKHGHITGKLGVYNGRPTAVGGNFFNERKTFYDSTRAIESLNETGEWFTVAKLPIKLGYFSVVSLESGALLIIDFPANCRIQRIYYLRNGEWIPKGKINLKYRDGGITKRIGSSIYFFPENQYYAGTQGSSPPTDVQKIELVDEEISSVEKIGEIRDYETILVFQTYAGYCVYN